MYLDLFLTFLKIGAFTFGGGYAMLPLIQEAVLSKGWLDEGALIDFIAVSESTPGPFAINISTYIGNQTVGILGGACATLGVVVPSFVIILIIAKFFEKFKTNKIVKGIMTGLKPAVIGLISMALLSVAGTAFLPGGFSLELLKSPIFISSIIIFMVVMFLTFKKKTHPILIIVISALLGIVSGYIPMLF